MPIPANDDEKATVPAKSEELFDELFTTDVAIRAHRMDLTDATIYTESRKSNGTRFMTADEADLAGTSDRIEARVSLLAARAVCPTVDLAMAAILACEREMLDNMDAIRAKEAELAAADTAEDEED